jgi:hypothetical protein
MLGAAMPKTAVHENGYFQSNEHHIGAPSRARQRTINTIAESEAM